jgi:serine phosphatase RsbU (regulator of sigma subunit)
LKNKKGQKLTMALKSKKIKFSLLFVIALSTALVVLALFLSTFFIRSIESFGMFTTKVNEKSIHEYATYLLKKNIESTAQYYSSIFNKIAINSELIANESGKKYDMHMSGEDKNTPIELKLKKSVNNVYYNNFTYKDLGVFIINKNNKVKISAEKKAKYKNIALHLIFEMEELINSNVERTPYMHDFWISFSLDRFYSGIYPNMLKNLKKNSVWGWNQGKELVSNFVTPSYFSIQKNKENNTVWSSIHYSMEKEPLISVITPIFSKKNGFIGATGTTLQVETVLEKIMGDSTTPKYDFGILDKNKEYEKYTGAFSFIVNDQCDLIAFPREKTDLFELPKNKSVNKSVIQGVSLADSKNIEIRKLAETIDNRISGTETIMLKGNSYIFAYGKLKTGWTLCTVVPEYEFLSSVRNSNDLVKLTTSKITRDIIIVTFILLCISVFFSFFFFNKYLLKPIINLTETVKKIGKGNFDINIDLKEISEINKLAVTFNYLCKELKEYERNLKREIEQRQIIETEVKVAGDIQASLLPKITDNFIKNEFDLAASLASAKDASGDFYDFFYVAKNKLVILIADVSGKGISAAFFMAIAKTLIKSICLQFRKHDPAEVFTIANDILNRDNTRLMFVTGILGFYDLDTGKFTFSNAGHHETLCLTEENKCISFGISMQMALGIMPDNSYTNDYMTLKPGEKLILYTDGISEAVDLNNNEYGVDRLKKLILKHKKLSCNSLAQTIVDDVIEFEKGNRFDDITLLILSRK